MSEVELTTIRPTGDGDAPPAYNMYNDASRTGNGDYSPREPSSNSHDYDFIPSDGTINPAYSSDGEQKRVNGSSNPEVTAVTVVDEIYVEEEEEPNCFIRIVEAVQDWFHDVWTTRSDRFWFFFKIFLLLAYIAYFVYAIIYNFDDIPEDEQIVRLIWVTCLVGGCMLLSLFWHLFGKQISEALRCCWEPLGRHSTLISWVLVILIGIIVVVFIIVDVTYLSKRPYNLVSLSGIAVYIILFFIFSYSPAHVQWRAVAWGLALQFVFALFILRWDKGYEAFKWIGDRVTEFLLYTDAGSAFIFGEGFREHFFAFQVLPTIVFFSTFISILYYLGVMQVVIKKVAWVMQATMGTTAGESLNAAGNIFVGQTEAPLLIRPLLPDMTRSEIHAVMTGGFATIAGGVLAAYILFGVSANHLISASVMSAPAALAMAKLFYPETEKSKTTAKDVQHMEPSKERNIVEAASAGASASIRLVANVAANLIAFIALLEFINTTLTWFGHRVGVEELTFQFICSYVLWPFAFVMGVDYDDCRSVGRMIGVKTFLNEFIAYTDLGKLMNNRIALTQHESENGNWTWYKDDIFLYPGGNMTSINTTTVLKYGVITDRSATIATYALCGFANVGSIGIQLGGLGAMAPERRSDLAAVAVRAMIAGNVACFLTGCIAGLFYQG